MPAIYRLVLFLGFLVAVGVGVYFYIRQLKRDPDFGDPVLKDLQARNPKLLVEDEFRRIPIYWFTEPPSHGPNPRKAPVPTSEAAGATVRFEVCNLLSIPAYALYPNRTEITCLTVSNEAHTLEGYYFRTKDRLEDVVNYLNQALEPNRRFTAHVRGGGEEERDERKSDGSRELIYTYLLKQDVDVWGFVGYREDRVPPR